MSPGQTQSSFEDISKPTESGFYIDSHLSHDAHTLLQDTYFNCMFNATLIFHRPTFTSAFINREIPEHLLLAVYATSIMY